MGPEVSLELSLADDSVEAFDILESDDDDDDDDFEDSDRSSSSTRLSVSTSCAEESLRGSLVRDFSLFGFSDDDRLLSAVSIVPPPTVSTPVCVSDSWSEARLL
jgi:hypothetical protein